MVSTLPEKHVFQKPTEVSWEVGIFPFLNRPDIAGSRLKRPILRILRIPDIPVTVDPQPVRPKACREALHTVAPFEGWVPWEDFQASDI
jgi:hypothetical protein